MTLRRHRSFCTLITGLFLLFDLSSQYLPNARIWAATSASQEICNGAGFSQFMSFSPDGNYVVVFWSKDGLTGAARVWNARTGQPLQSFPIDNTNMNAVFSPDSKAVLVVAAEAVLWDVSTGARLRA